MDNKQANGGTLKNEIKGRGLFYGVIAVATFIIMAVGATFAYFTATTRSTNSTVKTGSTTLQLRYISYGAGWMNEDLIPANDYVVEYSFENQSDTTMKDENSKANGLCKDDDGNSICSVYVFQVINDAKSEQSISIDVVSEDNTFTNLYAMGYEVSLPDTLTDYESTEDLNGTNDPLFRKGRTDETPNAIDVIDGSNVILDLLTESNTGAPNTYSPVYINRNGVVKTLLKFVDKVDEDTGVKTMLPAINRKLAAVTDENRDDSIVANVTARTANIAGDIKIDGKATKTFALVIYVKNENYDQTSQDADKSFTGRVVVSSGDGSSGVSGIIEVVDSKEIKDQLQSNQTQTQEPEPPVQGEDDPEEPESGT